jgi:hypothetical protein
MQDSGMPNDLAELEQRLAGRSRPDPAPQLRDRILAAIRREAIGPAPVEARAGLWQFAATAAALLLVCLNLTMCVVNHTDWDVWGRAEPVDVASQAQQLRQALPELSESEALGVAQVMASSRRLLPMPDLRGRHGWPAAPLSTGPNGTEGR